MQGDAYETELTGDRAELAAALEGIADGLRAGSIRLGTGEEALAIDLPEELTLEVEFETQDDEHSLELELEWEAGAGAEDISSVAVGETDEDADDGTVTADGSAAAGSDEGSAVERADVDVERETGPSPGEDESPEAIETAESLPIGAVDAPVSLGRFELYRDRADEWRWRLRHRNGNVIASSGEGYTRKANAQKGLRSVMRNAPGAVIREE